MTISTQASPRARWIGVGSSSEADSAVAGRAAAAEALLGSDPKLVIVFCSAAYDAQLVLDAINEITGGVPLIGCVTAGEIATRAEDGASVVVTVLGGEGFSVATEAALISTAGPRAAGAAIAGCANRVESCEHRVLMTLIDGVMPGQVQLLRGVYDVLGASIPIVGGAAGDDARTGTTAHLHGGDVLHGAAVAAIICSDAPMGIGVQHGWRQVGEPMLVGRVEGDRIYTLDERPALDAYLDRLGAPADAYTDLAAFRRFSRMRPLSVIRRGGDEVRGVDTQPNFDDRSLEAGGDVPQGGLTWIMEGDVDSLLGATDVACAEAVQGLGGESPIGFLAFDCLARWHLLGPAGVQEEAERIRKNADGVPIAGFYTFGEIARTRGINAFHHQTLVLLAIA